MCKKSQIYVWLIVQLNLYVLKLQNNSFNTLDNGDVKLVRDRIYPCINISKIIVEIQEFLRIENILSSTGESMVAVDDLLIEYNIVIFIFSTNSQFLSLVNTVYVNDTCIYCTTYFCQIFTIYGFYNNPNIPLVFCLLPLKCGKDYKFVFQNIKCLYSNLNWVFTNWNIF